ncbi:hypothetical protein, partial [Streptomyces sp. NPDC012510]|uniref:hypothetical protein n=1 Tax=Streptomyces sp. NPDC012510 TaxID=3364838 RepID=UPI0036E4E405
MDVTQAWAKIGSTTKMVRAVSAERTNEILNAAAPPFVPLAVRWDQEADRRRQLRTPAHLQALMAAQKAHNS